MFCAPPLPFFATNEEPKAPSPCLGSHCQQATLKSPVFVFWQNCNLSTAPNYFGYIARGIVFKLTVPYSLRQHAITLLPLVVPTAKGLLKIVICLFNTRLVEPSARISLLCFLLIMQFDCSGIVPLAYT
jgi:hypothetical protein